MLVLAVHVEWCCRFSLAVVVDNVLVVLLFATVFYIFVLVIVSPVVLLL